MRVKGKGTWYKLTIQIFLTIMSSIKELHSERSILTYTLSVVLLINHNVAGEKHNQKGEGEHKDTINAIVVKER